MLDFLPRWSEIRHFTPVMVFGVLFLLGGIALPWIGGPPAFDELVRISGDVELVKRTPKTRYGDRKITIVLAGEASEPMAFDAGPCHAGTTGVSAGTPITAWLDGEPSTGAATARAWQIHSGDASLCAYEANIEASRRAAANAGVMGSTFALIGAGLLLIPFIAWHLQKPSRVNP
jgi:hypothetical protein